jgi:hypothetical protein
MKISYAITVCNELNEIKTLLDFLLSNKREEDEIVVLFDGTGGTPQVLEYLDPMEEKQQISLYADYFDKDFANWKNKLRDFCTGDYIFSIDADEIPHIDLIKVLPLMLEQNPEVDMFLVPRINTVEGLTPEHITKWRWNVNEMGWVNFPDFQTRIYKNIPEIKWEGKVHERITGTKTFSSLPAEEVWSLYHPKEITRQEKQNKFYENI